jgi:hypothetical protein
MPRFFIKLKFKPSATKPIVDAALRTILSAFALAREMSFERFVLRAAFICIMLLVYVGHPSAWTHLDGELLDTSLPMKVAEYIVDRVQEFSQELIVRSVI